jgi:5-methylcytosine-specific restriction endonuclease McrA
MDDKYKSYLKSKEWFAIRESLFLARGKRCEKCLVTKNLHIHHLHYRNIYNEKPEDLLIVCRDCHNKIHNINPSTGKKILDKKSKKKKKKKTTLRERRKANILKEIQANRRYLESTYH